LPGYRALASLEYNGVVVNEKIGPAVRLPAVLANLPMAIPRLDLTGLNGRGKGTIERGAVMPVSIGFEAERPLSERRMPGANQAFVHGLRF